MPVQNAQEYKIQRYLPLFNGNSRFLRSLEGFWPLTECQGMRLNNLMNPSTYMYKFSTPNFLYSNSRLPTFQRTLRLDNSALMGTRAINTDLGPWSRFDSREKITLAIWMKLDSTQASTEQTVYGWYGEEEFIGFNIDAAKIMYFRIQTTPEVNLSYGVNYCDNQWHFLAATWQQSEGVLYVYADGVLVTSTAAASHAVPAVSYVLGLGCPSDTATIAGNFYGAALWTEFLTSRDIDYLYKNPYELIALRNPVEANSQSLTRIPDLMPFFTC